MIASLRGKDGEKEEGEVGGEEEEEKEEELVYHLSEYAFRYIETVTDNCEMTVFQRVNEKAPINLI